MIKNLVSIVMPFYKKKIFFEESFLSAINQSYKKIEIIIVFDDNDKKDLYYIKKIIAKYKIKVKLVINKKNKGVAYSRNQGIKFSRGEYLAFLDCDDYWNKNKLKKQISFMQKNRLNFSHTSYYIVDSYKNIIGKRLAKKYISRKSLLRSCDIGLSTVILKRKLLTKIKFPNLKTKEDYVLWLKISKKEKIIGLNKILTSWRKTNDSLSNSIFQKIIDGYRVYLNYEKFTIIQSIFMVCRLSFFYLIKVTKNN